MTQLLPTPTVLTAHLDDESVLLHIERGRYYRLNPTGQGIWRGLEAGLRPAELVAALVTDFTIDEATARGEIERFLAELSAIGLVCTAPAP
jgi:hypothetical protein